MPDFSFDVKEQIGVLSTNSTGWNREVNMVSWNGHEPKLDIRDWAPDHSRMGKGISLSREESKALKEILTQIEDL